MTIQRRRVRLSRPSMVTSASRGLKSTRVRERLRKTWVILRLIASLRRHIRTSRGMTLHGSARHCRPRSGSQFRFRQSRPCSGLTARWYSRMSASTQLGAQEFNQLFNGNDFEVTAEALAGTRDSLGGQLDERALTALPIR